MLMVSRWRQSNHHQQEVRGVWCGSEGGESRSNESTWSTGDVCLEKDPEPNHTQQTIMTAATPPNTTPTLPQTVDSSKLQTEQQHYQQIITTTMSNALSILPSPSIQLARSLKDVEHVEQLSALELFQQQLATNSVEAQIDAMHRLAVVAVEANDEATLLHCLLALVQSPQPDELLLLLGQQLVLVLDWFQTYTPHWLPLLEKLAAMEETVVREQAVTVLLHMLSKTTTKDVSAYWPLVQRLSKADWFTAKVSVCALVGPLLEKQTSTTSSTSSELLQLYHDLCRDETPMVRRAAAQHVGRVVSQPAATLQYSLSQVTLLCHDEQDSVRLLAYASLQHVPTPSPQWLALVQEGVDDKSWYVVYSFV